MRHTISYVSTVSHELNALDIQELLTNAKFYNNINEITGILIYLDGNFFQVIEGKTEKIISLFDKILKDTRHRKIIKIIDQQIEDVIFSKYYTSFTIISNPISYQELHHFLQREKEYNPKNFENISYLTHKFLKLS